jgi:hypothetical protein
MTRQMAHSIFEQGHQIPASRQPSRELTKPLQDILGGRVQRGSPVVHQRGEQQILQPQPFSPPRALHTTFLNPPRSPSGMNEPLPFAPSPHVQSHPTSPLNPSIHSRFMTPLLPVPQAPASRFGMPLPAAQSGSPAGMIPSPLGYHLPQPPLDFPGWGQGGPLPIIQPIPQYRRELPISPPPGTPGGGGRPLPPPPGLPGGGRPLPLPPGPLVGYPIPPPLGPPGGTPGGP